MKRRGKKKASRQNKLQSGIILAIVLVVFLAIGVSSYSTYERYQELKAQEAAVDLEIAEAEAEKAALEEKESYMKTDEYIKDMAREEFDMVEPGEYIMKSQSEKNN